MSVDIRVGDCLDVLRTLDAGSVQTCVTSPPYFGLRDYGVAGQIGLESTPDAFVAKLVAVFAEVRRVLADDGTLWLNLGDSYANDTKWGGSTSGKHVTRLHDAGGMGREKRTTGLKAKDLIGIPWRVAFALQADGWYLRSDIIWHKPNPMPESVTDRPTKAHEYLFLLSKSERYYYDAASVAEPVTDSTVARLAQPTLGEQEGSTRANGGTKSNGNMKAVGPRFGGQKYGDNAAEEHRTKSGNVYDLKDGKRNRRTVWSVEATGNRDRECLSILESSLPTADKWDAIKAMMSGAQSDVWRIATAPYSGAHFATFPPALIEPCILAGSRPGDTVLDPFGGAGTTGLVADRHSRNALLIELNPAYAKLARERITNDAPLFAEGA